MRIAQRSRLGVSRAAGCGPLGSWMRWGMCRSAMKGGAIMQVNRPLRCDLLTARQQDGVAEVCDKSRIASADLRH